MFPLLVLDAHRYGASVALLVSKEITITRQYQEGKDHLSQLHHMIRVVCQEGDLNLSDLSTIACTVGPGAYTSTRVAVTIAESLSYALSCAIIPLCSLEAWAMSSWVVAQPQPSKVWVAMDARQGRIYMAAYEITPQSIQILHHPQCFLVEQAPDWDKAMWQIGDGWSFLPELSQHNTQTQQGISPEGLVELVSLKKPAKGEKFTPRY